MFHLLFDFYFLFCAVKRLRTSEELATHSGSFCLQTSVAGALVYLQLHIGSCEIQQLDVHDLLVIGSFMCLVFLLRIARHKQ